MVLLRLLFESGVAKPHTTFKLCLVFNDVHRNRLFTFPTQLKVLPSPCFFIPSFWYLWDSFAFSGQCNKNLVMTIGCGWGLVRIWGHHAISDAFRAYSAHLSCGFCNELPCLVRCGILLLCFGRPGKHHLSYISENWCSLRYPFTHTRERAIFLLWSILMHKEWVISAGCVAEQQYDSGQGFFPFNLVGSLT